MLCKLPCLAVLWFVALMTWQSPLLRQSDLSISAYSPRLNSANSIGRLRERIINFRIRTSIKRACSHLSLRNVALFRKSPSYVETLKFYLLCSLTFSFSPLAVSDLFHLPVSHCVEREGCSIKYSIFKTERYKIIHTSTRRKEYSHLMVRGVLRSVGVKRSVSQPGGPGFDSRAEWKRLWGIFLRP